MTPIEAGETILKCIDYICKQFEANYKLIGELDKQLCDLQHEIEFTPFDIQKGYKLAKQTQDLRRQRREAKDENEVLYRMQEYLNNGNAKSFVVGFTATVGKAKKRLEELPNREYTPRAQCMGEEG
jgi:hypothetical protein